MSLRKEIRMRIVQRNFQDAAGGSKEDTEEGVRERDAESGAELDRKKD